MPPKNSKQCEIFARLADGRLITINRIENLTETSADISGEYIILPEQELNGINGYFTFQSTFEPRILLHIMYGNNWLRLHGFKMIRRCGYQKRKRK